MLDSSVTIDPPPLPLDLPGVPRPEFGSRSLFPDLVFDAYLGHAAISPCSLATRAAVGHHVDDVARRGAGAFPSWELGRARLRRSLAELLGAERDTIALTPGTTRGITDVALALPLAPGDRLVTFDGEFPANVTPWQIAARSADARVEFLARPDLASDDPRARLLEETELAFSRGARVLAVSAVQFQTGYRMPLRELGVLCKKYGVFFAVDAIQALGVCPLSVTELGIDALVGGAHKWLLGLEGTGVLYLNPEFQKHLDPKTAGWLSHDDAELFLFQGSGHLDYERPLRKTAHVFEGSSANAAGCAALEAGLGICRALGPDAIFEHVQRYFDAIEPEFVSRGFRSLRGKRTEERSTLLSFELPAGIALPALVLGLRQKGVMVSSPDGHLRIAPHFANHPDEVGLVVRALDAVLGAL